jgi:ATP/maltotriose-dependent transcriptional regulator MalT
MLDTAPPIVGRASELEALDDALAGVQRDRRACAVELAGEAGIGKTRLLEELSGRASRRGLLVLSGSASELDGELPFSVFVDALDEYIRALEPRRLEALDEDARPELARMFPSLRTLAAGEGSVPQDERYRTHRAIRQLLEVIADRKPLVLLLDDLHWADPGSIELLGSLLRRPPAAAVLIALALRPRQVPERLLVAVEKANRNGMVRRVGLGTLTREEAGRLLGDEVTSADAASLHEASGGNPFYLQQLARVPAARARDAAPDDVALTGADVPPAVVHALADELALLDPVARRLYDGAAVAGDPFELDLAVATAEIPDGQAIDALDELLRRDLVRSTDVARRFRFRHPLVRRAVYDASPAGWRLGAHERAAAELAARGAPATARAHHVESAARHGDMASIGVLRDAAAATIQRSPASAARWLSVALRLMPDTAPVPERIALLATMARALAASGRFEDARAALLECIAIAPPEPAALRVDLIVGCAGVEQLLSRLEEADGRLTRALAELPPEPSPPVATLLIELTAIATARTRSEEAAAYGARALEIARATGDRTLVAAAAATLAFAEATGSAITDAERHRSEAAELIDAMPDDELASRVSAIGELARAELYLDRFSQATAHVERGIAIARATAQGQLFPVLVPLLGWLRTTSGRLDEAAELLDGAIEAARVAHNEQALAWTLFNRAVTALHAGELDDAVAWAAEGAGVAGGDGMLACFTGLVHGMALIERGDPRRGVGSMTASAGGPGLPHAGGGWNAYFLEWLVRGLLAAGRPEDARRAVERARAVAEETGLALAATAADRAAARLAGESGDAERAAELAAASTRSADALGAPIEAGLSRIVAGRALAQAGEPHRAAAELERAATDFDRAGAVRYRAAADRELRRLGATRHRRTRPGWGSGLASLTERELEVARLIVDRRTNAEIAAELFLSQKTVESHVRNLFHKLGVASRVDVARIVEAAEPAHPGGGGPHP